jgi:hypothetical protein
LQIVDYYDAIPVGQVLPHMKNYIKFDNKGKDYYPVAWVNEFWAIRENVRNLFRF